MYIDPADLTGGSPGMNKALILEISEKYNLAPNKKLGQNFLINDHIINRIVDVCSPDGEEILEIGPGLGSISGGLADRGKSYTAVEIDSGFYRYLSDLFKDRDNARIIHEDFLKSTIPDNFTVIVSNLPYYCASEILFIIAEKYSAENVYVMMQKEMGERLVADPGSKVYGAMTVTLSYYFNIEHLFYVPAESFYPRPDVRSSFLALRRKKRVLNSADEALFHLLVKSVFWGRRKTLLKSLTDSPHLNFSREFICQVLERSSTSGSLRGENLSLDDFIKITEAIRENE